MFVDIHRQCSDLSETDRARELSRKIPGCHLAMVGGFPFYEREGAYWWCGGPVTPQRLHTELLNSLGASAVLTYMNPSNKTLLELGEMCRKRNHTWAYHWVTISILFCGYGPEAELAFTRDSRFFMSWPVGQELGEVFIATGSLKSWFKFNSNKNSSDFPVGATDAMHSSSWLLDQIC
jgi:hypothetical protein